MRYNPSYGYRRIRPDLEEVTGEVVKHKRLRRLLKTWELGLHRMISRPEPSPVWRTLEQAKGHLNSLLQLAGQRHGQAVQVLAHLGGWRT